MSMLVKRSYKCFYTGAPSRFRQYFMKVTFSWRRWRDTSEERKFRPIVLTPVRVALVVGILRLADATIPDRTSLLSAQSIGSTRRLCSGPRNEKDE